MVVDVTRSDLPRPFRAVSCLAIAPTQLRGTPPQRNAPHPHPHPDTIALEPTNGAHTLNESEPGHGHSPAAWTAVVIMLIGFTIGTLAFWFDIAWLVWASAGLVVVGGIVGWAMTKAGYGVMGPKYAPKARH